MAITDLILSPEIVSNPFATVYAPTAKQLTAAHTARALVKDFLMVTLQVNGTADGKCRLMKPTSSVYRCTTVGNNYGSY
jgi:hypothetical protein